MILLTLLREGWTTDRLAVEIYCYRIKKTIGAFRAVLGEVDALIFTGGIGEHAPLIQQQVMEGLGQLGFMIDVEANSQRSEQDRDIGRLTGKPRILVIHAEEECEMKYSNNGSKVTVPKSFLMPRGR
ncbi:MAG: hypothetical protein ACR65R_02620 [Methylomicrobium sp.]